MWTFLSHLTYAQIAANRGPMETVAGPVRTINHGEVTLQQQATMVYSKNYRHTEKRTLQVMSPVYPLFHEDPD